MTDCSLRRASVKRSNCYMVWGGDATGAAHASSRSNVDLEIGCLIDLATGLVTFTINGKETSSSYQVGGSEAPCGPQALRLTLRQTNSVCSHLLGEFYLNKTA